MSVAATWFFVFWLGIPALVVVVETFRFPHLQATAPVVDVHARAVVEDAQHRWLRWPGTPLHVRFDALIDGKPVSVPCKLARRVCEFVERNPGRRIRAEVLPYWLGDRLISASHEGGSIVTRAQQADEHDEAIPDQAMFHVWIMLGLAALFVRFKFF